jgi:flagellar biogenesis protein FliO
MTLSRQPIRVLSGALLASALYASPGQAQTSATPEAATSEPYPEVVAAPKPAVAPRAFMAPKVSAKPKAVAPEPARAPEPVVAPPEPAPAAPPVVKAQPAPSPERPKTSQQPWLRSDKAQKPVASAAPVTSSWRLVALGAVVLGLGAAALLQRRRRTSLARAVGSDLTVLSTVRVGNKAQVVVVNVGGRKLLLGVTEAEVSRLGWLEGDLEAAGADSEADADLGALSARGALSDSELFAPGVIPAEPRASAAGAPEGEPPRRFRELLFNALGQESRAARPAATKTKFAAFSAADEIAEGTRDYVTRGSAARPAPARVASPAGAPEMVDIEGQARGLVLRLQKRA